MINLVNGSSEASSFRSRDSFKSSLSAASIQEEAVDIEFSQSTQRTKNKNFEGAPLDGDLSLNFK